MRRLDRPEDLIGLLRTRGMSNEEIVEEFAAIGSVPIEPHPAGGLRWSLGKFAGSYQRRILRDRLVALPARPRRPGRPKMTAETFHAAYRRAVELAGPGATNKELANAMDRSPRTVERWIGQFGRPD